MSRYREIYSEVHRSEHGVLNAPGLLGSRGLTVYGKDNIEATTVALFAYMQEQINDLKKQLEDAKPTDT